MATEQQCRIEYVDGEAISVRGSGPMSPADLAAFTEVVRAAKAKMIADPMPAAAHDPCCSSHGVPMSCARYRRTHFVDVRPCCEKDAERLGLIDPVIS